DGGMMWVGSGNSIGNFAISRTTQSQFELALKGYKRGEGDTAPPIDAAIPVYTFDSSAKAGFAYSLAALDGKSLAQKIDEGYSFYLDIDTEAGSGQTFTRLKLHKEEAQELGGPEDDSGYKWVSITDDAKKI